MVNIPTTLEPGELYSIKEAAGVLQIPVKRVEYMVQRKLLPSVRQSCKIRKIEGVVLITLLREIVTPILEGRTPPYIKGISPR